MARKYKEKERDYEPIRPVKKNPDKDLRELEEIQDNDGAPDDLTSVLVKFLKKFNAITGLFILILYTLISTDCFQLHIMREIYPLSYDINTDTITDCGIMFNGVILSVFYMIFDVCYNQDL